MKQSLPPLKWAKFIGMDVLHQLFRTCKLIGLRTECESNNNLMLLIKTPSGEYYWVYEYETYIIQPTAE